jgi:two-component system, OmpR family, sensor kinase
MSKISPYKGRIGNKLVITFVLFVTIFVGSTGWFLYRSAKNSLDNELGGKLVAIAQTVTTQIEGIFVTQLLPGDETTLTYANVLKKLNNVKQATGVKRLYIFDKNNRSLVDTDETIPIGTEYSKLRFDKSELQSLWNGNSVHTVLFKGTDGAYYKSGYAPIIVDGAVVSAVGVDTSATIMEAIRAFGRNVIIFAIVSILITVAIGFLFARTITRPIDKLVKSVEEIGKGNFENEIHIDSNDELGYLGNAMESMRNGIIERDKRLKMMLANVAHEIRNPLGGIEIFAGILAEDLQGTSKDYAGKIIKEVRNLNDIITQFLEYARPSQPVRESVQLNALIDDVYFLLAPEFQKKSAKFTSELNPEDTKIYVDPKQINRVLINILKNSLQVIPEGGEIKLKSEISDNMVRIMMSDNGHGIPSENLEKIFDPFFTTKEKGAGLGLSIVKKLIEDNSGKVTVESDPGKYTTFTVSLPHSKDL